MNERIKELANQCYNLPDAPEALYYRKFDHEKFAELIIRECIDIISPYASRMENFDGGHPIAEIKKHFGVEKK